MSLLQLIYTPATAQINLVPNPSFEEIDSCPKWIGDFFVNQWINPTGGSPDNFHSCSNWDLGIPSNAFGNIPAKDGVAYVGLYMLNDNNSLLNHREYVQSRLTEPLFKDELYEVSFYIALAKNSKYACDNIGVLISDTPVKEVSEHNLNEVPQYRSEKNIVIDNVDTWSKKSFTYLAKGEEQYITIGYFFENSDVFCKTASDVGIFETYYYIDCVSVSKKRQPFEMPTAFSPNDDLTNDSYYPVSFAKDIHVIEYRIYNRWGEIVHDNPSLGWDGKYNNVDQPIGIYSYYVYADLPSPDILNNVIHYKKKGYFTLIR